MSIKKVSIFHNLRSGGALSYIECISREFIKNNWTVDLYTFSSNTTNKTCYSNIHLFELKKTNNIIENIHQLLFELPQKCKQMALEINDNKYDLMLFTHCDLTQTPYIINYIDLKSKCTYICHEPKREFYEKTTFDYFSLKRRIARTLRLFLKYNERSNIKKFGYIVTPTAFAQNNILTKLKTKSYVINPVRVSKIKSIKRNNKRFVSVGAFQYIKGHDRTISLFKNLNLKLDIYGMHSYEYDFINKKLPSNIKLYINKSSKFIKSKLKQYTFFVSNCRNEPLGLTNIEASKAGLYILGLEEGGLAELIKKNKNGKLFRTIEGEEEGIDEIAKKSHIKISRSLSLDWKKYYLELLQLYNK